MFTRRQRALTVAVMVLTIAGCTSVSSPSEVPSTSALSTQSADVTAPPSTLPPSKTPKPPTTAPPSTGPSLPNLVIAKFVAANDPIQAGVKTNGRVTIKNEGTADAGPFDLGWGFSADEGGGGGGNRPQPVDGLAAGDSVQLTVDLSLDLGGGYTFTATADSGNVIAESNEDDNSATLHVTAVSDVNLVWPEGAFSVTPDVDLGGYDLNFQAQNTGTAPTTMSFSIGFAWSSSLASGTFPSEDCCFGGPGTVEILAAGALSTQYAVQGYSFPSPATYTVVATLDSTNIIPESDETDNTATVQVDVTN